MRWVAEVRERARGLLFRRREEAEMEEEMRDHLERETERLVREQGLHPREARRRAAVAFGAVEKYKEEVRDARGLAWVGGLSLDFKLGLRMLFKYPGLTMVGVLAIAFGVAVGAACFEAVTQLAHPTLPLSEGGRIVGIRNWDAAAHRPRNEALHDFAAWRQEVRSVRDMGAFRTMERNLITTDGTVQPVQVAEMSASAFRLARVPPLLGRTLTDADEQPGAADVIVIGHDVWRTDFGGDPRVIGRTVRLGRMESTIVGVMPPGFAFPVSHGLWAPLRLNPLDHERGKGPALSVFGRLAPGASRSEAQAELSTLGQRAARDFPATHRHLRPEVLPYAESLFPLKVNGAMRIGVYSVNFLAMMFLALLCANVATLVFARTATRESEIVVRNALGASRGRIVMQLFAEALVLAGVAALAGLAAAAFGLRWGVGVLEQVVGPLPFWFHASLSPATVLYAGGLTVLGAALVGILPALKVTGRGLEARLRQAAVGGGGANMGRLWTAVIVIQVAFTAAFLPLGFSVLMDVINARSVQVGIRSDEYLAAWLGMDSDASPEAITGDPAATAGVDAYREFERRLEAEPGVAGVTFADLLPRMDHPQHRIQVDGDAPAAESADGQRVSSASVDVDYFQVMDAPVLSGRAFHRGDLAPRAGTVIVNQSFVSRVLGGRNPIGRRVRYAEREDGDEDAPADPRWYEIVGVVRDMGMTMGDPGEGAGLYHAVAPGAGAPVYMAVHVRGEPETLMPRLREMAAEVHPGLRLNKVMTLNDIQRELMLTYGFWLRVVAIGGALILLLSVAGIYSVMSCTVSRRTREIGIRSALGAGPGLVVRAIFSRALTQLGLGVAAGTAVVLAMAGGVPSPRVGVMIAAGLTLVVGAGMLACILPTRRALRIAPTEALNAE